MAAVGSHLGPYELLSSLGSGGMGEVFKARDTRLDRTVAIKILSSHLAADADAQARFEREARSIAALNHPHICTLYDIGHETGTDFLVMELVQGETLATRLERGALPLEQALKTATDIADALDAAHRHGIVHRDLKPGNIMLTKGGVKLLDFGLAKLCAVGTGAVAGLSAVPTQSPPVTDSGRILGTVPYMAPEQLEGKEVDARSDIFALGAVIYEMTTGRRPFESDSDAGLIAAVLRAEALPVSRHQPLAPPVLDTLVQTCLAKEPDARWSSAHDIKLLLQRIVEAEPYTGIQEAVTRRKRWNTWAAGAVALFLGVGIGGIYFRRAPTESPAVRSNLLLSEGSVMSNVFAISPDGRRLAYVGSPPGGPSLPVVWVRLLNAAEAEPVPGTERAHDIFWSRDSRFIGFFADGKLKKVAASGGRPETLCDTPGGLSGTWNRDGVIVFAEGPGKGLYRVSATGGTPTPATTLNKSRGESGHRAPYFLRDGRHFLYSVSGTPPGIYVASLDSQESKRVVGGENPVYAPPGYLIFQREETLLAQRLDVDRLEVSGEPMLIDRAGRDATVSDTGVLIFQRPVVPLDGQLFWTDRAGRQLASVGRPGYYQNLRLSPDGKRLAVGRISNDNNDIWILDLARGTQSRFTFEPTFEDVPVWSPDGSRIVFAASPVRGFFNLYEKLSSGAGKEELLLESTGFTVPTDWSPDGRFILYQTVIGGRGDLWVLPLFGERKPMAVARTESIETDGQFSPDGRWIAYVSDGEIYVQTFPPSGGKWQISTAGGRLPRWRKDGKELFYWASGEFFAVPVKTDPTFEAGAAKVLFGRQAAHYAVTNDGQRFLIPYPMRVSPRPPTVIVNWTSLLGR